MPDCLIIGAGILGLMSARLLNQAGVDVMVIDKQQAGRESSWAGGGILSPLYPWRYPDAVNRLAGWSQRHYPALIDELLQETGIDPELVSGGMLILDPDEAASDWLQKWQVTSRLVSGREELQLLEPALSSTFHEGLLLPDVQHVRNPRLLQALQASLRQRHVPVLENTPALNFLVDQGRVTGIRTPEGKITADQVLVTAGSWSGDLLSEICGEPPEIEPVKGQMLLYHGTPGLVRQIILHQGYYVIPRRDGRVLVGSSMEYTGFDKSTSQAVKSELIATTSALLPALNDYPIEQHWAGLRPGSPQGIPYIGGCAGTNGLYVNAGHFRNGVVMGLASARLCVDQMLNRESILDPLPYQPGTH